MEPTTSTHKTNIDQIIVQQFLDAHYQSPISNLTAISGDEGSQAFSFTVHGKNLIIRINKHDRRAFEKDSDAYSNQADKYNRSKEKLIEILELS